MVTQARTFRDKALLFVLYESGCRIGELARLKWKDVVFNDDSTVGVTLTDTKTRKLRHALLGASVEYLAGWRNNYPGTPDNEKFVFISTNGEPMEYRALSQVVGRTAKKAGVDKRVTPHLYRKSQITSLIKQNYQESVIKQAMWGNLGTNMFKTYVVLSEQDIDAEFREKMGIEKKEIKEDEEDAPPAVQILFCHERAPEQFLPCLRQTSDRRSPDECSQRGRTGPATLHRKSQGPGRISRTPHRIEKITSLPSFFSKLFIIGTLRCTFLTRNVKLSEEVYEALQIIKVYPSTSFNDAIKGLIETQFPGISYRLPPGRRQSGR